MELGGRFELVYSPLLAEAVPERIKMSHYCRYSLPDSVFLGYVPQWPIPSVCAIEAIQRAFENNWDDKDQATVRGGMTYLLGPTQ